MKGMVDDVTLHHYGGYNIYWEFGDMVYITVLVTIICSMQTTALTPHAANRIPALLRPAALAMHYRCKKVTGGEWVL